MSESAAPTEVNARIVYWGPWGGGKTANLHTVHAKLRPDHRGELQRVPTPIDPTVTFERLPIELGQIAGVRTRFQIVAVPGAPDQAPTRKQLLDRVDGVVFVADAQPDRIEDNAASFEELGATLADYGRRLSDVPLVVQYNKRDLTDAYALERLHKRLGARGAAAFEAVATEGTGVLQTLTTLSKRVIRTLRERPSGSEEPPAHGAEPTQAEPTQAEPTQAEPTQAEPTRVDVEPESAPEALRAEPAPAEPPPPAETEVAPSAHDAPTRLERAILEEEQRPEPAIDEMTRETQALLDAPWEALDEEAAATEAEQAELPSLPAELRVVSVGEATREGARAVRVPVVLGDKSGRTTPLVLTIRIDALPETEER